MTRQMEQKILKEKIDSNRSKIELFNNVILLLGILFIIVSFLTFYTKSVLDLSNLYYLIFTLLLVLTIMTMIAFKKLINEREKENKRFQHRIQKLIRTIK